MRHTLILCAQKSMRMKKRGIEMRLKEKKLVALFFVFSLLFLSVDLCAKEKRGANIKIYKIKTEMKEWPWEKADIRGELIAVKKNILLLKEKETGVDVSVDVSEIKSIKVMEGSTTLGDAALGALVGVLAGGLVGLAQPVGDGFLSELDRAANFGKYALVGVAVGGIGGALLGMDESLQIEGKSDWDVSRALEKLRKKARIRDYQ
jgi:hypothetical protein